MLRPPHIRFPSSRQIRRALESLSVSGGLIALCIIPWLILYSGVLDAIDSLMTVLCSLR